MIETTNNIIFYLGYILAFTAMVLLLVFCVYLITRAVLGYIPFSKRLWDRAVEKSLKNISQEQFDDWIKRVEKKYKDCQQDISSEQRAYMDKVNSSN